MEFFILTGASRGLGAAIVDEILKRGHKAAAIARSPLKARDHVDIFPHDLNEIEKLSQLMEKILSKHDLEAFSAIHLINNAAVLEPMGPPTHLDARDLEKNIRTNLVAPMVLAGAFLKQTEDFSGIRTVVNISSGVADSPLASWSAYSAAKSGLKNFSHALALELKGDNKTKVISFSPGIMDTEMQALIRRQTKETFAEVERFRRYKEDGHLLPPTTVARTLLHLLENPIRLSKVDVNVYDYLRT